MFYLFCNCSFSLHNLFPREGISSRNLESKLFEMFSLDSPKAFLWIVLQLQLQGFFLHSFYKTEFPEEALTGIWIPETELQCCPKIFLASHSSLLVPDEFLEIGWNWTPNTAKHIVQRNKLRKMKPHCPVLLMDWITQLNKWKRHSLTVEVGLHTRTAQGVHFRSPGFLAPPHNFRMEAWWSMSPIPISSVPTQDLYKVGSPKRKMEAP